MKFGVGNKRGIGRKLSILLAVLMMFSILDAFSVTIHNDKGKEILEPESQSPDDGLPPELHGVRSATPSWSPLSGQLPSIDDYYSIDFGDVNNDGKQDVIVGSGQNTVIKGIHCWLGDGNGGWIENSTGLPITNWKSDVELEDLNNDGKLDIACGGGIYTGNGGVSGEMIWTQQNSPGNWNGVALGDVDNNGTIDIAGGTDLGVRVWTSNGGVGSFVWTDSSGGLDISGSYWGVDFGDVNNDGKLDVAAASHAGEGVKVWTGNGESGPLALWTDAFSGTGLPTTGDYAQLRLGDANNDGKLDLAVARDPGGVRFFKGNGGEGGFTWVEESNGLPTSDRYLGLSFSDVNNDGNLDLIGANYAGAGIQVWLGDGGQGGSLDWTPAREGLPGGTWAIDVCLGDVNNDGRLDIGATTNFQGIQIWAGNLPDLAITGWTSASTNLPTGSGWYDVVFGDVDHDGKLDLAAASSSGQGVKVFQGDGNGVWTEVFDPDLPSSGNYNGVRLKDINHDGDLDLIASNDDGTGVGVWLGNGSGGFGIDIGPGDPPSPPSMGGVEVSDINNDGDIDIASCFYNPSSGDKVFIWLGNGDGSWGPDIGPSLELGYDDVAFGDVDHNGTMDLFSTTHMIGFRFWLGDGNGGWDLQPQMGLPTSGGGLGACFGDVNHDGNLDIAIGAWAGSYGMRVYTSDGGAGGLVDWTNASIGLPTVGTYAGVELGDIDHDGNLDLLSANAGGGASNGISLTLGNGGQGGSMIWTDALLPDLPSSGNYWGVAFGDVNNDGVLDIAITSGNGVRVYITQTQISYKIDLFEGWNLISLPMIQTDTSVDAVLASINGQYKAVQCFDTSDAADPWKHYAISKPSSLNDLTDVDHTMGIWIYITEPGGTTLTVYGNEIVNGQSIIIRPGWNLVGYPSKSDKSRDVALNNTLSDINWVGYFDASTDRFVILTASDNMEVGRGYWVHSIRDFDIVWNVPP